MTFRRALRTTLAGFLLIVTGAVAWAAHPQAAPSGTTDIAIPPGSNYDKAEFRLWYPPGVTSVRAIVVLVPGSNGDGRAMAEETGWQTFAVKNRVALLGTRFTDQPHDQSFIEHYVDVSRGSGQALLTAVDSLADKTGHSELAAAPFLMWGMSAGGQFNYEFVAWKPERVAAFVVNKGGIYYSALLSPEARNVPGMLFIGGKDLESRIAIITGLFQLNRRAGALWALAEEPGAAHVVGRSIDVAKIFFEDALVLRVREGSSLQPINERDGIIGDIKTLSFQLAIMAGRQTVSNPWLLTDWVARAWKAMATGESIEP